MLLVAIKTFSHEWALYSIILSVLQLDSFAALFRDVTQRPPPPWGKRCVTSRKTRLSSSLFNGGSTRPFQEYRCGAPCHNKNAVLGLTRKVRFTFHFAGVQDTRWPRGYRGGASSTGTNRGPTFLRRVCPGWYLTAYVQHNNQLFF